MLKKVELLAPAGTMDALHAAVNAGADAVYLGSTLFSARAFAGNFDHDQMTEAVRYCHQRGVSVYVTMNTLLFEDELERAMQEVDFLYHADVDALLIQDLGLFQKVHACYPDFDIHCSTQMHIHNVDGCRFMKEEGARRVVLARETPLDLIKECVSTGVDIEVFCYGASCISYSGQCLMSAEVKNRSGNRGMCAQMCRLRYTPIRDGKPQPCPDGDYVLSPKDINLIERVPDLIQAGVASLKIEGRMKRPEYVYLAVKTFREAIDACYAGKPYHLSAKRDEQLKLMFNRGFSQGHFASASVEDRMSHYRPNHRGIEIGSVLQFQNGRVLVQLSKPLHQHDGLRIVNEPVDTGLTAVKIEKNGLLVNSAMPGDKVWLECHSKPIPKRGQKVLKTSSAELIDEIDRTMMEQPKRREVTVSYIARIGEPLQLVAKLDGKTAEVTLEQPLSAAKNAPLTREKLETSLAKTDTAPFTAVFDHDASVVEGVFLPVSMLNEARRTLYANLLEKLAVVHDRTVVKPYHVEVSQPDPLPWRILAKDASESFANDSIRCVNEEEIVPVIHEQSVNLDDYGAHAILSSVGDFFQASKGSGYIAGITMNLANSAAIAFTLRHGCSAVIFSSEVPELEIARSLDVFSKTYGFVPCTYRLVYGRRTLMFVKGGFMEASADSLKDMEGRIYPLRQGSFLTKILAPEPYRSQNRYCYGSVIVFTGENEAKQGEIIKEAYEEVLGRV